MSRWQLARAGILNVYQYENETLEFRGGRLLLRGVNGSGKSTAMNMLLPFLLTDRTRGDAQEGTHGNLRDRASPRADHLVIGCGIKANRASDTITTWWFVTGRRPGIDLNLVEHGLPLSAEALRATLASDSVFAQDRRAD